jgi:putative restriction endonuclease
MNAELATVRLRTVPSRRIRPSTPRRLRAQRIARVLLPAVTAGFVSTEVEVRLPGGRLVRPDVVLACREPPADGLLDAVPELVVTLSPRPWAQVEAQRWLAAGVAAVWSVDAQSVVEHTAPAGQRLLGPDASLAVPGLAAVRIPAAALLT